MLLIYGPVHYILLNLHMKYFIIIEANIQL